MTSNMTRIKAIEAIPIDFLETDSNTLQERNISTNNNKDRMVTRLELFIFSIPQYCRDHSCSFFFPATFILR
jgi:hypothetical protein